MSMKRGCTQSLITTASSVGGSGVSVSSQSCSTDLCNTGDARQNFNLNNFNDFLNSINNLNAAPVLYPVYTGYPAFSLGLFPVSLLNFAEYKISKPDDLFFFLLVFRC